MTIMAIQRVAVDKPCMRLYALMDDRDFTPSGSIAKRPWRQAGPPAEGPGKIGGLGVAKRKRDLGNRAV